MTAAMRTAETGVSFCLASSRAVALPKCGGESVDPAALSVVALLQQPRCGVRRSTFL